MFGGELSGRFWQQLNEAVRVCPLRRRRREVENGQDREGREEEEVVVVVVDLTGEED